MKIPCKHKECGRHHEGSQVEYGHETEEGAEQDHQHPPQHGEEGAKVHEEAQAVHSQLVPGVALEVKIISLLHRTWLNHSCCMRMNEKFYFK